jgi:hypothetical protein
MSKRNRRHGGIEKKAIRHLRDASRRTRSERVHIDEADFAAIEERILAHYGIAVARALDGSILWDIETMRDPGRELIMPTGWPARALHLEDVVTSTTIESAPDWASDMPSTLRRSARTKSASMTLT